VKPNNIDYKVLYEQCRKATWASLREEIYHLEARELDMMNLADEWCRADNQLAAGVAVRMCGNRLRELLK
jgi:hypothetical protein